jgi:hypothetical protein
MLTTGQVPRIMYFKDASFHPGLNMTLRRGPKWADLKPGDQISLSAEDPGDSLLTIILKKVEVVATWEGPFGDLPDAWLRFEHSPACRDREELKVCMDAIYGNGSKWEDECVAILFWY